ncbi:MAG TPA: PAS domain S-box protein [Rhodocyclaceae bacterium]|nr:PAS domain S-box protein [Rhodocyclaceae bacterium]
MKNAGRLHSLSRRVAASLALMIALVSAVMLAFMYFYAARAASVDLEKKADETVQYLAGTLELPLWNEDKDTAALIAKTVFQNDLIATLKVSDAFGNTFATLERNREAGGLERTGKIFHQGMPVGVVELSLTTRVHRERERELLGSFALAVLLIVACLMLLTGLVVRALLRQPLGNLNRIVDAYSAGIYEASSSPIGCLEFQAVGEVLAKMGSKISGQLGQLKEAEQRYRSIFENATEGIFQTTMDGQFLNCNPALAGILGYLSPEVLLSSVSDIANSLYVDKEQREHLISLLLEQASVTGYEAKIRRQDGRVIWGSISARLVRDEAGTPLFIEGFLTDITDRKQSEQALQDSRQRLDNIVANSPGAIYRCLNDSQWTMEFLSAAITRITGYPADDFLQNRVRSYASIIHPDDRKAVEEAVSMALPRRERYEMDYRLIATDGSTRWVHEQGQGVFASDGRLLCLDGAIFDITDQKMAAEEIRKLNQELEQRVADRTAQLVDAQKRADAANKAKSVFLANMSHELRTPLNAILGFSGLLRRDSEMTERQRKNLDIINRSGEHLLTLINDVLEITKIEAGRLQLEITAFDLGSLVRDVVDMMQVRAQEKGLSLMLDQSSEFPRYIMGDEARLRQILVNLIGNAVKFTEEGGVVVRLGVRENSHRHLLIDVEDTGPGISPEDQQRVFQPFVQLVESGEQKGTGLGLTITRQFVQMMGGVISVESTLGKGTCFRVDLPIQLAGTDDILQPEEKASGDVIGLAPGQPLHRILIAEDQRDNQLLLSRLMTDLGFEVKVAENGEQCIRRFQDWHPDLIWMDRRMPVMDGMEATRQIRQLPEGEQVKIVAVTASAFTEQQQEMLDVGMNDFVRKPYRLNEIYECLARQLGVQYLYHYDNAEISSPVMLKPEMLATLPTALRQELKAALEDLDTQRITEVLQKVAELDGELGRTLSRLAGGFDYMTILQGLESASPDLKGSSER